MKINALFRKSTVETIEKDAAIGVVLTCIGFAAVATFLDLMLLIR